MFPPGAFGVGVTIAALDPFGPDLLLPAEVVQRYQEAMRPRPKVVPPAPAPGRPGPVPATPPAPAERMAS